MKIKRPSLKGSKNTKYLGHFAQDKWINKGHNDVYGPIKDSELSSSSGGDQYGMGKRVCLTASNGATICGDGDSGARSALASYEAGLDKK